MESHLKQGQMSKKITVGLVLENDAHRYDNSSILIRNKIIVWLR